MAFEKIETERDREHRLVRIRLDNPDNNVLDFEVVTELGRALDAADRNGTVDAIILGTAREQFCAGADLDQLAGLDRDMGNRWLTAYLETVDRLRDTGKPTIAAVEGACVAGGNELIMGCDLVVAGESARFGQPEVGVGSTAAAGGVQLLPLVVGEKRARELLLTGDLLTATEAERYGLINRVVDDGNSERAAVELALDVVENASPQAYRVMKGILKNWTNLAMHHREMAREITAAVWASEEFGARAQSFVNGRDPERRPFTGVRPKAPDEE